MSEIPKDRRPFKQQIMDLLLQIGVSAAMAREVAVEVITNSTIETPAETIRTMMIDYIEARDADAAGRLAQRFTLVKQYLQARSREPTTSPGSEVYDEEARDQLLEDDEITAAEAFFMEGREGHPWQRKREHRDSRSVQLAEEEYFED